jgi:hypothetical protein
LMVSRGMSQVSAIILAIVSNVEDIGNSLVGLEFGKQATYAPGRARQSPNPHSRRLVIWMPVYRSTGTSSMAAVTRRKCA